MASLFFTVKLAQISEGLRVAQTQRLQKPEMVKRMAGLW